MFSFILLWERSKAALEKLRHKGKIDSGNRDTLVGTEELVKDLPFDQVYCLKPDGKFELVEELQAGPRFW